MAEYKYQNMTSLTETASIPQFEECHTGTLILFLTEQDLKFEEKTFQCPPQGRDYGSGLPQKISKHRFRIRSSDEISKRGQEDVLVLPQSGRSIGKICDQR